MGLSDDLDQVLEEHHRALDEFVKGDSEPLKQLWSQGDDVTLGNPFGPFVRGFDDVVKTMARAALNYRDGRALGFETVAKRVTGDLAYVVETERYESKLAGGDDLTTVALRCTSIFAREGGVWRLQHRHADPITTARTTESLIQT
jgi:ketosteroid isomerase-like protein